MKKTTLVFDLDGTLLNTLEDLCDSTNYALSQCGYPERTLAEVKTFVGNGIRKLIERAVPSGTSEEDMLKCLEIFKAYYPSHAQIKTRPYDGIIELLKKLKDKGYKTAIVSNKYQTGVTVLARDVFMGLVDVAVGERAGVPTKPAPDMVEIALKELGVTKEETVYIGDSDVDVMTAKNSELDLIAVEWGFRDKELLIEKGAKVFAKEPKDILEEIERGASF